MRLLVFLAGFLSASLASADLYRWIDRETGAVKFSSYPPPWYGDPEKEARSPAVEVIPSKPPARPITSAPPKPVPPTAAVAELEARFLQLLQSLQSLAKSPDLARTGTTLRQQIEMYQAVSVELDRQDPAGAARRRALVQESGVLEQLRKGLEAQFKK